MRKVFSTLLVSLLVLPSTSCWAKSSLESRVDRLEVVLDNQANLQLLNDVELLKQEIRELRGALEEYQHDLRLLQQQQEAFKLQSAQSIKASASQSQAKTSQISQAHQSSQTYQTSQTPQNSLLSKLPKTSVIAPTAKTSELTNGLSSDLTPELMPTQAATQPTERPAQTAQQSYQAAYSLLDQKQYQEAETAFQDFLWKYPDNIYVANAYYWLGEIYLLAWHDNKTDQLNLEKAINSFNTVVTKYPNHNKAGDCLLKLGLTEIDRENWQAAKEYLMQVTTKYPGSSRAKIADTRLKSLQAMGVI